MLGRSNEDSVQGGIIGTGIIHAHFIVSISKRLLSSLQSVCNYGEDDCIRGM